MFFKLKIEQSKKWLVNNQAKAAVKTPHKTRQFLNVSNSKGGAKNISYVNI